MISCFACSPCARLLPALLVVAGCNSTGVGNPNRPDTVSLAIVADQDPEAAPQADAGAPTANLPSSALEHALLVLGRIQWLPCAASEVAPVTLGPIAVDLVTGEARPPLPDVEVPEGGLCGFDAPLAPALDWPELHGRTLLFSGTRADGVPFLLFADMRATLRVRAAAGEAWGATGDLSLLWALQPRRWASAMELDAAQDVPWRGGRIVVIDVNRNPLLYLAIRSRLAGFSAVFVDTDSDGALDASEKARGEVGLGSDDVE